MSHSTLQGPERMKRNRVQLSSRFEEALLFAARLHAGQRRKASGVPYVAHLLTVAGIVLDHGGDEETAIAALLHDAIEDQGGEAVREEIRSRFGDQVTAIIDGCTEPYGDGKPPWMERKRQHLNRARACTDPRIALVLAADKLHNVRSLIIDRQRLGENVWDAFTSSGPELLWYYGAFFDVVSENVPVELRNDLRAVLDELERIVQGDDPPASDIRVSSNN